MSMHANGRFGVLIILMLPGADVALGTESTSYNIEYKQHWIRPDTPASYGRGQVVGTYPSIGDPVGPVNFTLTLADTGYTTEWDNVRDSEWDLVASIDGTNWAAEQVDASPSSFSPHSNGGAMTVRLTMGLDNTNGQQKQKAFEIYGTCWGLRVSPPTTKGAHFVVRGRVAWKTALPV
jgi:hypothetical protein